MQTISTCSTRDQVHPQQPLCSMFKSHNSTPTFQKCYNYSLANREAKHTLSSCTRTQAGTQARRQSAKGLKTQLLPYVAFNKRVPLQSENCTEAHSCYNLELVFSNERIYSLKVTHSSGQSNTATRQTPTLQSLKHSQPVCKQQTQQMELMLNSDNIEVSMVQCME